MPTSFEVTVTVPAKVSWGDLAPAGAGEAVRWAWNSTQLDKRERNEERWVFSRAAMARSTSFIIIIISIILIVIIIIATIAIFVITWRRGIYNLAGPTGSSRGAALDGLREDRGKRKEERGDERYSKNV